MQRLWIVLVAASLQATTTAAQTTAGLLQKGIYTQDTVGDVDAALAIFQQIVKAPSPNRRYAAQAQARIVRCLLLKGDATAASIQFDRLVREYGGFKEIVSTTAIALHGRAPARRAVALATLCRFSPYELNRAAHTLLRAGKPVDLTAKEFKLLSYMAARRGCALSRDHILNAVWGHAVFVTPRSVDRCVATLRAKIDNGSNGRTFIETIRDVGYRFDPPPPDDSAE